MIPVIIYHCGGQSYLKAAIEMAEKNAEVFVLIGDSKNSTFSQSWVDMNELDQSGYKEFERVYEHMSTHDKWIDLIIFKKYYIIRDYMAKYNIEKCFILDADVLLYDSLSKFSFTETAYAAVSTPKNQANYAWASSPHVSFWTYSAICDFTDYMINVYKNHDSVYDLLKQKYDYQQKNGQSGGICDMTLLYHWSRNREKVYNTCVNVDGTTFEHCMTIPDNYMVDEYEMDHVLKIKKVEFVNNKPYLIAKSGKKVFTPMLHFQGEAKAFMPYYLDAKNPNHLKMVVVKQMYFVNRVYNKLKSHVKNKQGTK